MKTSVLAVGLPFLAFLSSAAFAHIVEAPATVRAEPNGDAAFKVLVIAESVPFTLASYTYGGTGICGSGVGDAFCVFQTPPGDTIEVTINTRLCDPEVPGLCETQIAFCDADGITVETHVFPHSGASVGDPVAVALSLRNHPNPVRGRTTFELALPRAGQVSLRIYDLLGRRLASPLDEQREAGASTFDWNATGTNGVRLSPGVYVAKLEAGGRVATRRFVITN